MGKHRPNHRRVKTHRNYSVEEIARLFGIHKNTVHNWIKDGLSPIDNKRPLLILGSHLAEFIKTRREKSKSPCQPGELYCLRCRAPRTVAENMADYSPDTETTGNLIALCSECGTIMNRRVNLSKINDIRGEIDISFPEDLQHIVNS
ncbi:MAG: DNA-binding protein [Desulfuromonas sp.]|nr:MAG: DNA-binding protein [Desulfuromonas sp.]